MNAKMPTSEIVQLAQLSLHKLFIASQTRVKAGDREKVKIWRYWEGLANYSVCRLKGLFSTNERTHEP